MSEERNWEYSIPTLLGRAGVFQQRKKFQFFGPIANVDGVLVVPENQLFQEGWTADYLPQGPGECGDGLAPRKHKCERLWRIGTASQTVYRVDQNALTPLTPDQFTAFEEQGVTPAGSVSGGNGWFRVLVKASGVTGQRRFFLDVDETVELYALQVEMAIVGTAGIVEVTDRNSVGGPETAEAIGTVIDSRIGAVIEPIESPTGLKEGRFTQVFVVPQNGSLAISVPRFARRVKIYQDNVGASSGPWTRVIGPINLGTINFTTRASRDEDAEIGREAQLVTDTNALNARTFVVQWTIRP